MADKVAGLPLAYQPGTKWLYSLSMDIQGAIIEKLSGQSLPDFMRTRIFEPLGMVDTAFHTPPEKRARRATLYRWSPTAAEAGRGAADPRPRLRDAAGAGQRRRRPGLDRGRLRPLRPDAAERRRAGRQADRQRRGAEAADDQPPLRRDPGRRLRRRPPADPARLRLRLQRRGVHRPGAGRRAGRQGDLPVGRRGRHLVLGRSGQRPALRRPDPAPGRELAAAAEDHPDHDGGRDLD